MFLEEIVCEGTYWTELADYRGHWLPLVNTIKFHKGKHVVPALN
jgi:hypothetical protein